MCASTSLDASSKLVKQLNKKLAVLGVALIGFFLATPFAYASTIYQQFTDSSGDVHLHISAGTGGACTSGYVGSFITPSTTSDLTNGTLQFVLRNSSFLDDVVFHLSTSSTDISDPAFTLSHIATSTDNSAFLLATSSVDNNNKILLANTQYNIKFCASLNNLTAQDVFLTANLAALFFYGYITADSPDPSLPILPGLPGFSNTGISTTSQQVYCNANSTSSGLLDSLGQSISLGICNVGVFLFVPPSSVISNWNNTLASLVTHSPFNWIGTFRTDFQALSASSTENFVSLSLAFGTTTNSIGLGGNLMVISTSTLSKYYPDPIRQTGKGLIGVTFILLGVSFMYRDIQRMWHKQV